ncbi:MAG: histidinol dehydrogenase [Gammaproteobacteria bacterium]|nr:histidinol dehydrogenase [Gammaproteobacteria bacterium]
MKEFNWTALDAGQRETALSRPAVTGNPDLEDKVADIIARVREGGDAALLELTQRFDGITLESLRVTDEEMAYAETQVSAEARAALQVAIKNVTAFHAAQLTDPIRVETSPGVVCERVTRPVGAVGLYVPAGSAPLPSTAIMLCVPATLAECPTRIICTPPRPDGRADPAVIIAAKLCGVDNIYKVGGAQAVAAMAYGTDSVPKVDKIFGPGNAWVTAAKTAVARDPAGAALDMPAGPSEVMVVADGSTNPRYVALDLLSQAEHGPDSQAVLVCTDVDYAQQVYAEIESALPNLPRRDIIEQSLSHSVCFIASDAEEALEVANRYAAEHLIIQVKNARQYTDLIINAGSVFLGPWTPESVGDYCSGTNHVLPTYGFARNYSGLAVRDFQKQITMQELTRPGLEGLAPTVLTLAGLEGLDAHAQAVVVRLEDGENS